MPQSDPPVSPPGAPPGFDERHYTTFRQGQVNRLQLLLPLSFTQEEEAALAREAQDQQSAYESAQREVALQEQLRLDYERKIKKKLALEAQELEAQEETWKKPCMRHNQKSRRTPARRFQSPCAARWGIWISPQSGNSWSTSPAVASNCTAEPSPRYCAQNTAASVSS